MNGMWLPAFLNEPIPAIRLYVLRVGVAWFMLFDVFGLYMMDYDALYGTRGYTTAAVSDIHFQPHRAIWSVFRILPQPYWFVIFLAWLTATVGMLVSSRPRVFIFLAWACATSVLYANPLMHSGGDRLRGVLLFTILLSPLPTWRDVKDNTTCTGWPAKFLLFQLAVMYFFSGAYKLRNPAWQDGTAMYYVLNNGTWCLAPKLFAGQWLRDLHFFQLASWGTVLWEMSFPLLVWLPWTRWRLGLGIGILFHLLCAVLLQVSTFPWYSLACYLPLVPWEQLVSRTRKRRV